MTYVHVDHHTIAFLAAHRGRDDDERVPGYKVAYASLARGPAVGGDQVELEGLREGGEEEQAAELLQQRAWA